MESVSFSHFVFLSDFLFRVTWCRRSLERGSSGNEDISDTRVLVLTFTEEKRRKTTTKIGGNPTSVRLGVQVSDIVNMFPSFRLGPMDVGIVEPCNQFYCLSTFCISFSVCTFISR